MGLPIIGDLIDGVKDIVSEVVVDKDKRMELDLRLEELKDGAQARLDAQVTAQIEVNKVEASSGSVFVAGWRPAVGWVGAASLAYTYILQPFIGIFTKVPDIDAGDLTTILLAMLGIGGMRTFEKYKGVSTNDYRDVPSAPPAKTVEVKVETEVSAKEKPKRKFRL